MTTPATFVYSAWLARYPEFGDRVTSDMANAYVPEATLYAGRASGNIVILNALVAHIAALNAPNSEGESNDLVGRISNASQGSVSVATEMNLPDAAAYFAQTKYGVSAWQMMAGYRLARVYPRCRQW